MAENRDAGQAAYYHRGKEHRESTHFENEIQARKLLKQRLDEMSRGHLIGPTEERLSFEDLAKILLTDYKINGKRSIESVRLSIRHLGERFGLGRAIDITANRVAAGYVRERQREGAANGSINRELAALKRAFTQATRAGKLNSAPYVPLLRENNSRRGFLDHASFLALRDGLSAHLKDPVTFSTCQAGGSARCAR